MNTYDYEEEINKLKKELALTDKLLQEQYRIMEAIPACPVHGNKCIPHAVEWINIVKTLGEMIMDNKSLNLT